MIFEAFERTDSSPASYMESEYKFLNRCLSPAAEKIRRELERWLHNYPAAHRAELASRFRSEFYSAFFELLIHELLSCQGCAVAVHPNAGTKGRKPDFEACPKGDASKAVIVEATLCMDDEADDATDRRMRQVYDAINEVDCPFYFIKIRRVKLSADLQPSSKQVKAFLSRELGKLDPEDVLRSGASVCLRFKNNGTAIDFEVISKSRPNWTRLGLRNIGMFPARSRWGDCSEALRSVLNAKAKRYGDIGKPFVIAVNMIGPWGYEQSELLESLFGTQQEYIDTGSLELKTRNLEDGFWGTAESPRRKGVSAVVLGCVAPVNVPRADIRLYHNPWAAHPLPANFWKLPAVKYSNGTASIENMTSSIGEALGLPGNWPGDLFPNRRGR